MREEQLSKAIAKKPYKNNSLSSKRRSYSSPIQPLKFSTEFRSSKSSAELTPAEPDPKPNLGGTCSAEPQPCPAIVPTSSVVLKAPQAGSTADPSPLQTMSERRWAFLNLVRQKGGSWQWLVVWLSALCLFGGMATSAFVWLTELPPLPQCDNMPETVGVQRLYCAQQTARSGKLPDLITGISLLKNWSPDQPFYEQAQQLTSEWSALVLIAAQTKIDQNDLPGAIAAASQVPVSNPMYQEAQKAIAAWKTQWHKGDVLYAKAEVAIRAQSWKEAAAQVNEMGFMDHEYWRIEQADALGKRILAEKTARQALTQAQKLATGNPHKLGEAIALVEAVPPTALAAPEAKVALTQWSRTLLGWAMQQWQQGNVDLALATARQIPLDLDLPQEGRDLIYLSQAQQQISDLDQQDLVLQVWNLMEANSAISQIASTSPFYQLAQTQSQLWQAKLQDMIQLQFANGLGRMGDRASLEAAIAQAQQIAPNRPARLIAQSLIARWTQEIQKLEDRPYLLRAEAMAKSGKVADLQRAIVQAKEIPNDRALWQDAQTQLLQWKAQIEVIEDQPLLNQAKLLAKQNNLPEAIQTARKIAANRALSQQAQAAIETWQAQIYKIQTVQDQPIMDQANALAGRGRLTMAIDLASQIEPGRALYSEAQISIKIWSDERADIWSAESVGSEPDSSGELDSPSESDSLDDSQ